MFLPVVCWQKYKNRTKNSFFVIFEILSLSSFFCSSRTRSSTYFYSRGHPYKSGVAPSGLASCAFDLESGSLNDSGRGICESLPVPTHIPDDLTIFTSIPLQLENSSIEFSNICAPPLRTPNRLISTTIVRSSVKARLLKAAIPFIPCEIPLS
jgi:hypothetical protein